MSLLWQEFKAFALKGNMVDMAIGIIIGAAFSRVVSSLVSDIIMPPLGLFLGGVDLSRFSLKMNFPGYSAKAVELKYGAFINSMMDFMIIALAIFAVIKVMNKLRQPDTQASKTKDCPECRMSIPIDARKCGHCCSILTTSDK